MIKKARTQEKKEELLFKFMDCVSTDESTFFRTMYESYDRVKMVNGMQVRLFDPDAKKAFIEDVEKNGFYIVRPPHKPLLFDDVIHMYDTFPQIKPKEIYVDIFGTQQRQTMRRGVIGYMYMIVLKQNSNKNFSARSTFRVNRSNLPVKDIAKKTNRSSYARTPVRLSEIYNVLTEVSGNDLAEYNIFMRSSALGRKSLDRILSSEGNPLKLKKLKVQDNFTNANADILAAKLKTIGIRLFFSPIKEGRLGFDMRNVITPMTFDGYTIMDYPTNRAMYRELFELFREKMKECMMYETYPGERSDTCWDRVFEDDRIQKKYTLDEDTMNALRNATKSKMDEDRRLIRESKLGSGSRSRSSSSSTGEPRKKRGRKSKAEKEQERLLLEEQQRSQELGQSEEEDEALEEEETEILEDETESEETTESFSMDDSSQEEDVSEDVDDSEL